MTITLNLFWQDNAVNTEHTHTQMFWALNAATRGAVNPVVSSKIGPIERKGNADK